MLFTLIISFFLHSFCAKAADQPYPWTLLISVAWPDDLHTSWTGQDIVSSQCRIKTGGPGALRKMRPPKIKLGVSGSAVSFWGSAVSSHSGVCGGAPAEIEFGVYSHEKMRSGGCGNNFN